MAKNEYFLIVYKILAFAYASLKQGERVDLEYISYKSEYIDIDEGYWNAIMVDLYELGYIDGVIVKKLLGNEYKTVKLLPSMRITNLGIQYLEENSMLNKVKEIIKEKTGLIPNVLVELFTSDR